MYIYKTKGTCSSEIRVELDENNKITQVQVIGGCPGNLQGIMALLPGMDGEEVISKFSGIRCGSKRTSCPDQIALAVTQAMKK